jgi:hypothetical protein
LFVTLFAFAPDSYLQAKTVIRFRFAEAGQPFPARQNAPFGKG